MTDLPAGNSSSIEPHLKAATAVLLRDGDDGLECLMLHKSPNQAFGGAWVFPGGRVEAGDGSGLDGARQAAVREVAEETELRLDPSALVPISHWTPPPDAPRRYSTWFFIAALSGDTSTVVTDGGEIEEHVWTTPTAAFTAHRRGELELLPPTWLTLHRLESYANVAAGLRDAADRPVQRFATRIVQAGSIQVALWSPDAAFPEDEADQPRALDTPGPRHRLYMDPAGWRYEQIP